MVLKQQHGLEKKMKPIEHLCQKISSSLETISAAQEKTEREKQEKLEIIKTRFMKLYKRDNDKQIALKSLTSGKK